MRHYGHALAALLAVALPCGPALALGVGEMAVHSSLGQPLRTTIPVLFDSPEELEAIDTLRVRFERDDSHSALSPAVAPLPPDFFQLDVVTQGEKTHLALTSTQPFLEPVSTLLLKVSLGSVSIVRELPLLLDLPQRATAVAAAPTPERAVATSPASPPTTAASAAVALPSVEVAAAATATALPAPAAAPRRRAARASAPPPVPSPTLTRFQLDYAFASYAMLKAQGLAPAPVTASAASASTPAALPVAVASVAALLPAREPAAAPVAPVAAEVPATAGPTWWPLALLLGVPALGWSLWRRRGARSPQLEPAPLRLAQVAETPLPPRPAMKAEGEDNERSVEDDFESQWAPPMEEWTLPAAEVASPAPAPAAVALPTPPPTGEAEEAEALRVRIQDLLRRTLTPELRTRLQVAEAHLDLRRLISARCLIEEVERGSEAPRVSTRLLV